jgi:ABC-three component (ABC-3C) system Middle Component 6
MIFPHRFLNFNYCLLNVTSLIIQCLLERNSVSLEQLLRFCKSNYNEINEEDILLSVSFLYSVGRVKYLNDNDLVTLVK